MILKNANLIFENYREGQTAKGKNWYAIQVLDEDGNEFMLFGEKAKEYKEKNYGEEIKEDIKITSYFNHKSNKTEIILGLN